MPPRPEYCALLFFFIFATVTSAVGELPEQARQDDASKENKAARDRHGDPLPPGAMARLGTVRLRHYLLRAVAYSPDGKALASSGSDGTIRLWDPRTGKEIRRFAGPPVYNPDTLLFSPDGKFVAAWSQDGTARLWETAGGKELLRFDSRPLTGGLVFSRDSKVLFTGGQSARVYRWDVLTGKELEPLNGGRGPMVALALSPDGKTLAGGTSEGIIQLWETHSGRAERWRWQRCVASRRD